MSIVLLSVLVLVLGATAFGVVAFADDDNERVLVP